MPSVSIHPRRKRPRPRGPGNNACCLLRPFAFGARRRRITTRSLLLLVVCINTAIYMLVVLCVNNNLLAVTVPKVDENQTPSNLVSKDCWLRNSATASRIRGSKTSALTLHSDSHRNEGEANANANPNAKTERETVYRILCTSTRKKMAWGSYKLRCQDLKAWAQTCAKSAHIVTGVSYKDVQTPSLRWFRSWWFGSAAASEETTRPYNATIFVKSFPGPGRLLPLYGTIYADMVDEYGYSDGDIPPEVRLLLQTEWQGREVFGSHNYSVVEHWYNSFPRDMALSSGPPEFVPPISKDTNIRIATIWNTKRDKEPTEGGCPEVPEAKPDTENAGVTYSCLDKPFDISTWYRELFPDESERCDMELILADPQLGPGMLYYNVFRKFDALVVLAKNDTMKLDYGNVQRAVSQMRSGVPVLLEVRGRVLDDFVERYRYPCVFQRYGDDSTGTSTSMATFASTANGKHKGNDKDKDKDKRNYPTFHEALEQLQRPEVRQTCQKRGLEIVEDYSPSRIAQKFLRAVGFDGEFQC